MMTSYDQSVKQTDVAVNEIVERMAVPLAEPEHLLIRAMHEPAGPVGSARNTTRPGCESGAAAGSDCAEFAVAP